MNKNTPFNSHLILKQQINESNFSTFLVGFDLKDDGTKEYRLKPFVSKLLDAIHEFAFGYHNGTGTDNTETLEKVTEAAKSIYKIDEFQKAKDLYLNDGEYEDDLEEKYLKRGEFGELILHLILRDFYQTIPLLSKIYFKDSRGHTVHGFDSVHIEPKSKTLWLGESKLYTDGKKGLTRDQLAYTLKLAWDNLLKPTETVSPMTLNKLVTVTQIYGSNQNIWVLVENTFRFFKSKNPNLSDEEIYDLAILDSFQILKHWFEYKVPKWLSVINSIQEFVCNEKGLRPGNYSFYSKLIETDFLRDNLSILYEYGIPSSAIRKLEKFVSPKLDEDEVVRFIKENSIYEHPDFIAYEKNKFNNI